jgi:hypothetical protein
MIHTINFPVYIEDCDQFWKKVTDVTNVPESLLIDKFQKALGDFIMSNPNFVPDLMKPTVINFVDANGCEWSSGYKFFDKDEISCSEVLEESQPCSAIVKSYEIFIKKRYAVIQRAFNLLKLKRDPNLYSQLNLVQIIFHSI